MVPWTYDNAAHLLRRAGFGADRKDVERAVRMGQADAVEAVLRFRPSKSRYRGRDDLYRMQRWWLNRMFRTRTPLAEKMTLFWHGHFATAFQKVENVKMMSRQNGLFRSMATGKFRDLLLEVSRDPAMILWLDNIYNVKGRPNENYAREIMELFSLGVVDEQGQPNYTELDVREAARAFTGWSLGDRGEFEFHDYDHDHGNKVFMTLSGDLDGVDIVNHLADSAQCGRFLAQRLWTFFAYPSPETAVVDELAQAYETADTEIEGVLRAMFLRDEFYGPRAHAEQVTSPVEFVIGTLRAFDAKSNGWDLPYWTGAMGQELFNPPNVAGWPGGLTWMNSVTRLNRFEFAWAVAAARGRDRELSFNVDRILKQMPIGFDGADVVDRVLQLAGPVNAPAEARQALITYMDTRNSGIVQFDPNDPDHVDRKVRGVVGLVLTLAESHLG
jgi:uncharacterized protein (DUF1800 family)